MNLVLNVSPLGRLKGKLVGKMRGILTATETVFISVPISKNKCRVNRKPVRKFEY
jgi:hypothetical protein